MMLKDYFLRIVELGEGVEQQDALEYSIYSGWLQLTYNFEQDKSQVALLLPDIVEQFRRVAQQNMEENEPLRELVGSL